MGQATEHFELIQTINDPTAARIVSQAIDTVDATYSYSGNPTQDAYAELYLPYHNGLHTRYACGDVKLLRDVVGLTPYEYDIALMAMASHDVVQELDNKDGKNEDLSAGWLEARMQDHPRTFTDTQIQYGRLAIAGTKYTKNDIYMVCQQAYTQDYPSKSAERIAHVVAGADLGQLYTAQGPYLGHKYYQEHLTGASGRAPSADDLLHIQEEQVQMVHGGYTYPTLEITLAMQTKRREVVDYSLDTLKQIKTGNIATWAALLQRDLDFIEQNK